jgi:signal transduction histidine kinase
MRYALRLFFYCLISSLSFSATSDPVTHRELFYDPSNLIHINQLKEANFQPSQVEVRRGFERGTLWLKLTVDTRTDEPLHLRFEVPILDEVIIYTPVHADADSWKAQSLTAQEIATTTKLALTKDASHSQHADVYIGMHSEGLKIFAVDVVTETEAIQLKQKNIAMWTGQLGIVITLIMWSLFNFLTTRKRIYIIITLLNILYIADRTFASGILISEFDWRIKTNAIFAASVILLMLANATYLMHLFFANNTLKIKRQKIFYSLFLTLLSLISTTIFLERGLILTIGIGICASVIALNIFDVTQSLIKKQKSTMPSNMKYVISLLLISLTLIIGLIISTPEFSFILKFKLNELRNFYWPIAAVGLLFLFSKQHQYELVQQSIAVSSAALRAEAESERRKNQQRFLSMLMHEIRTPLSIIKFGAAALTSSQQARPESALWSQRIDVAIDNITQVIENCTQADQHEEGLIQPTISQFIVNQEVIKIAHSFGHSSREDGDRISLKIEADESTPTWVATDIEYLRLIFFNLLSNALKYSPPHSLVIFSMKQHRTGEHPHVQFEIKNQIGKAGAPDETHVFQRYYRAESAKKFAGTGLGLWLSQSLAEQLGSQISMVRTDQEVVFKFALPTMTSPS